MRNFSRGRLQPFNLNSAPIFGWMRSTRTLGARGPISTLTSFDLAHAGAHGRESHGGVVQT